MQQHPKQVLLSQEQIAERVRELGVEITRDFQGKSPLLVGVLKGCVTFMSDLARAIDLPCEFEFMKVSSYGNETKTSGSVKILMDLGCDIEDRDVIIVEDILDSGLTLDYLIKQLEIRKPASITICTLLEKPSRRQTDVAIDYLGFQIDDLFVVGYGLDYAGRYRNLPYIGVLEAE